MWSFVYGNYIDEVLLMIYPGDYYCFYAHDHLYSPVTLTFETSDVLFGVLGHIRFFPDDQQHWFHRPGTGCAR